MPIHIETSGVDQITGTPNWITLSPKKHAPPTLELLAICQEIKVIIHQKEDLIFAEEMAEHSRQAKKDFLKSQISKAKEEDIPLLFLQPGWKNAEGESLAYEYVKSNPQWRLSLQTHKLLGVL